MNMLPSNYLWSDSSGFYLALNIIHTISFIVDLSMDDVIVFMYYLSAD